MSINVSILISSFMRPHLLRWNLYSLAKQGAFPTVETIVLNDGIPDDTENLCREYRDCLNIKYVFTGQRNLRGQLLYRVPAFALNIGARMASGEILIISCAEMYHINNTISLLTDPLWYDSRILATSIGMDDDGSFLDYISTHAGNFELETFYHRYPRLNTKLPFLMAIHRNEFFAIGGYDEDFTGLAYDDNDLVDRLQDHGCRLCLTQAKTIHLYHVRHDIGLEQSPEYLYNQRLYLSRKHQIVRNIDRDWGTIKN